MCVENEGESVVCAYCRYGGLNVGVLYLSYEKLGNCSVSVTAVIVCGYETPLDVWWNVRLPSCVRQTVII